MELRAQLEELARRLHLVDDDRARALHADVQRSIDGEDHEDLGDKLTESAVHFEAAHPDLADLLRRVVDALAASGM